MNNPAAISSWLKRERLPVVLVWSCLAVLPIGRVVELPVLIMAVAGLYLLFKHWRSWRDNQAFKLFVCVFLLAWIPILVSLVDAVRPQSTGMMSLNHLRFGFGGIFILHVLSTHESQRRFLFLCAWLLLFWLVDGLVQLAIGWDLFGFAIPPSGRINGLFGEDGLVLGILLAVLCPLLWEYAGRNWSNWQVAAIVVATIVLVLAAGARSAWITLFVVMLAYGVVLWRRRSRISVPVLGLALVGTVAFVTTLWLGSEIFAKRVETAIGAITGSTEIGRAHV